jgi:chaperone required for assembly of F1-ATPase
MMLLTIMPQIERMRQFVRVDEKNLRRPLLNPVLTDMQPLIAHMLECEIKLEQEAIGFAPESSGWGANRICDIIKSS